MTEAEQELQNSLTTTFLANLVFLSEYDNQLFQRVDELSKMIENKTYKEKYRLEFIMESGDFDIYDIINNNYLYNKNPKKRNNELITKLKLDEKDSIFDLPEYFLLKEQPKVNKDNRFNYKNTNDCCASTYNDTWQYANVLNDFLEKKNKKIKRIKKFIFLGTLLGRHIPKIAQKFNAEMYLVLERNLEIFRLSLFTTDYTIVGNKGAIFSIMDNSLEEERKILKFIKAEGLDNYLLKLSSTGINIDRYIDKLLTGLHIERPSAYDYTRILYIYANRATNVLNNRYKVLQSNEIKEKCKFFNNIPILYLAAGPSLDENLKWIKTNQDKFFIVTVGAAYKKLLSNNIRIDVITTLDESDVLEKLQFDDEGVSKISEDTIVLASVMTNEKILKKLNKKNLFLFEIFSSFHLNNLVFDGFSVGEITLAIIQSFNPKQIYLIGLDLALNQSTGSSHSKESNSIVQILDLDKKQTRDTFVVDKSLIKLKGNLQDEVFTTAFFFNSIKSAEAKILTKNETTKIYNLSKHGVFLEGTIPTKIENLKIKDFNSINLQNDEFKSFLDEKSLIELSEKSKNGFIKELAFLNKKVKDVLKSIKDKKCETYDDFYNQIIVLPTSLYVNKISIFYQIVVNYFQLIIPYLSYHFNDLKVKDEKNKVKEIKEIFVKQMESILNDYIVCLERVIK